MKTIHKLTLFLLLLLEDIKSLVPVNNDFVQIGEVDLTDAQQSVQVTFATPFNSIPKVLISHTKFDTLLHMSQLDYEVKITNINQSGFTASLAFSISSKVFLVGLNYTATEDQNIYQFSSSVKMQNMISSQDANYAIYTSTIPYSQKNLIDTPGVNTKIFGYLTGYIQNKLPTESYLWTISASFEIKQTPSDKYSITITCKEKLSLKGQLQELRFNYFEYYYYENSSRMIDVFEERSYEYITDNSNCLFNNLVQTAYETDLPAACKQGLVGDDITLLFARIQPIPNSLRVSHSNKQDFTIGYSKLENDMITENGRTKLHYYDISQNAASQFMLTLTYYTWQGTIVTGIASTVVEYYNLACPINQYYSFTSKSCIQNCESHTYKESNQQKKYLLPTCQTCHQTCLECSGPLQTNCLSCSNSFPYYNIKIKECLAALPSSGQICMKEPNNSTIPTYQYNCYPCADNLCDQCSGTIANTCTKCILGAYLYKNTCSATKPPQTVCDNNKQCQDCTIPYCLECSSLTTCSNCPPSFYLDVQTFSCKCPYGSYLDQPNSQCSPCTKNCANCVDGISCIECAFNSIVDPIYPGKCIKICNPGTYYDRQTGKCQQCDINCATCNISSLNCTTCKSGTVIQYNSSSKLNECVCSDPKDVYNDLNGTCQHCSDIKCVSCDANNRSICTKCIDQAVLTQANQCDCIPSTYYSLTRNSCVPCSQSNCAECSSDGTQCTKCKEGYYFNNKQYVCQYCTSGKYTDSNNQCIQDCPAQCDLCSNSTQCDKYMENAIFTGDKCFYACSKCTGSNYNQCTECNSATRTYDANKNTCSCKSSYRETDSKDCEYNPDSSLIFQVASISTTAQYFAYLPTIFINFHPFSDYFIINSQLIGNHYYSKDSSNIGIFVSHFAKFNYFNLFDKEVSVVRSSLPQRENSSELYNSIPFFVYALLCYICIFIAYIAGIINKKKIPEKKQITDESRDYKLEKEDISKQEEVKADRKEKLKNYLNWNLFIKVNRISSNLILMYSINNYEEIYSSVNLYSVSIAIYASIYTVYIFLMLFTVKNLPDTQSLKYLTDNLHNRSSLTIYLWFVLEFKKIVFCFFFFLNQDTFLWAQFALCVLCLFYLIISKPCQEKRRDCLYLILSEFILIMILVNLVIMKQNQTKVNTLQDVLQNQMELINIIQLLQLLYSMLHTMVVIEYGYRIYLQAHLKSQQSLLQHNNQSISNNCIAMEQKIKQEGITMEKIQNILNQRSFSIHLHDRKAFQKTLL